MASETLPVSGGGAGGGGSGSSQQSAGSNIYTRVYIRQVPATTAGTVKLQIRAYFYYAPYDSYNTGQLHVYLGSSYTGKKIFSKSWTWHREGSGYHAYYSDWYTIPEQPNATTLNIYAICQPADNYADVGYALTLTGLKPSYLLTINSDDSISSYKYDIDDASGINGGKRANQTSKTAIVYSGDKVSWSAAVKSGYTLSPTSGSFTVSGNKTISLLAKAAATIHVRAGNAWNLYSIYIRLGGAWVLHQANIRVGNTWKQYS